MKGKLKLLLVFLIIGIYIYLEFFDNLKISDNIVEDKVTKVVDGDTFWTEKTGKIRVIGVNSPEISKEELYANEATLFAKNLLLNKKVYLEKDVEDLDKYGRKLRYIWLKIPNEINDETIMYNYSALSIKAGSSKVYTFKPNDKYEKYLKRIQEESRRKEVGMWKLNKEGTTRGNELR